MNEALPNFELRLREALAPVEPPADLVERVEGALEAITELAAGELEAWELSAMRDPRNWARPAAAIVVGGAAATALILVRAQRRSKKSGRYESRPVWLSFVRSSADTVPRSSPITRHLRPRLSSASTASRSSTG